MENYLFVGLILIAVFSNARLKADDQLFFDPSPLGQDVLDGDAALLRCDVSSRYMIAFYWTLNNKLLANGSRRYQEDSNLKITRVDKTLDAGSFRCVATNLSTGVAVRSSEAVLDIIWISSEASVQEVTSEGSETLLKCHVTGNPEPSIDWFKNGARIQVEDRSRTPRNHLRILQVTSEGMGVYSCRANNRAGTVESVDNFVLVSKEATIPQLTSINTFSKVHFVNKFDNLRLDCSFQKGEKIVWSRNQSLIGANSTRHSIYPNGTLVIRSITSIDIGQYRCTALVSPSEEPLLHSLQPAYDATVMLSYLEDMSDSSMDPLASAPHVVPISSRAEAKCYPSRGLPVPSVKWLNPSGHVIESEGRVRSTGGMLTITSTEEGDSGIYRCVVENMAARKSQDLEIVITVPPKVQKLSTVETAQEGDPVSFECRYSGNRTPFTSILWKKNGAIMEHMDPTRLQTSNTKLKILNVVSSDEGSYGCVITTRGHTPVHVHVAQLYVTSRLKFLPMPSVVQLEVNTVAKLPCFAEGEAQPIVFWRKINGLSSFSFPSSSNSHRNFNQKQSSSKSSRVPLVSVFPEHISDDNGVLKFDRVKKEDVGLYVCFAVSTQGSVNFTVKVEVVVRPHLVVKPTNVTVTEMSSIMINCQVDGDPKPSMEWIKILRTNFLDDHRIKICDNGSLWFSEVHFEDIGWYSCNAFSDAGFDRQEFYIHVVDFNEHLAAIDGEETLLSSRQKMILITICCILVYIAVMVALVMYCVARRRRMKKMMMISEEIRNIQNDLLSASSSSSSKCDKLSTSLTYEIVRLTSDSNEPVKNDPIPHFHWSRSNQSTFSDGTTDKKIISRDRLQIISHLGRGSYGDVLLAKLLNPPTMSPSSLSSTPVVMVKMLQCSGNTMEGQPDINCCNQVHETEHNYNQLENIYDDVHSTCESLCETARLKQHHKRQPQQQLVSKSTPGYGDACIDSSFRDSASFSSKIGSSGDCYENLEEIQIKMRKRQEFMRDLELLKLTGNQSCVVGLIGSCTRVQPNIIVCEYSDKGDLRNFLRSFIPDQLPNMPIILTLERQLHFCHQVALGMLRITELVKKTSFHYRLYSQMNSNQLNFNLLSTTKLLPFKNLAARNVVVTSCLDAKICLDGACFDSSGTLDDDHIWHNGQPLLLRWSSPEMLTTQSQEIYKPPLYNISSSSSPSQSTSTFGFGWPSDVWSYGMLVLEIFTFAALPFPDLSNTQVLSKLLRLGQVTSLPSTPSSFSHSTAFNVHSSRIRNQNPFNSYDACFVGQNFSQLGIGCPLGCPEMIWQMVRQCLGIVPWERPSFEEIVSRVETTIRSSNGTS